MILISALPFLGLAAVIIFAATYWAAYWGAGLAARICRAVARRRAGRG